MMHIWLLFLVTLSSVVTAQDAIKKYNLAILTNSGNKHEADLKLEFYDIGEEDEEILLEAGNNVNYTSCQYDAEAANDTIRDSAERTPEFEQYYHSSDTSYYEIRDCHVEDNVIKFPTKRKTKLVRLKYFFEFDLKLHSQGGKMLYYANFNNEKSAKDLIPYHGQGEAKFNIKVDNNNCFVSYPSKLETFPINKMSFICGKLKHYTRDMDKRVDILVEEGFNGDLKFTKNKLTHVLNSFQTLNLVFEDKLKLVILPVDEIKFEAYGMIGLRQQDLLTEESPNYEKNFFLESLTNKVSDQWFKYKKEIEANWLYEALTHYMISFVTGEGNDFYFIRGIQELIFEADGFIKSKPLNDYGPNFLKAKGDIILSKFFAICNPDEVKTGFSEYLGLDTDIATLEDFAKCFSHCFDTKDNAINFFRTWDEKAGYPVVHVDSSENDKYSLEQERFLWTDQDKEDTKWVIPVELKNKKTSTLVWLSNDKIIAKFENNNSWLIINDEYKGLFRVNYNTNMWKALTEQLIQDPKYISYLTRSQLINDVFSLSRSTKDFKKPTADYSTALKLSNYLKVEEELLPISSAIRELILLDTAIYGYPSHTKYRAHLKDIFQAIYRKYPMNYTTTDDIKLRLVPFVIHIACTYGVKECLDDALKEYDKIIFGERESSQLDTVIFCAAARTSADIWKALFQTSQSILGCTNDLSLYSKVLLRLIDPEKKADANPNLPSVVSNIISGSPENTNATLHILLENINKLKSLKNKESLVDSFLSNINHKNMEQIAKLAKELGSEEQKKLVGELSYEIKRWHEKRAESMDKYFEQGKQNSGDRQKSMSLIMFLAIIAPFISNLFSH